MAGAGVEFGIWLFDTIVLARRLMTGNIGLSASLLGSTHLSARMPDQVCSVF